MSKMPNFNQQIMSRELLERVKRLLLFSWLCQLKIEIQEKGKREQIKKVYVGENLFLYLLSRLKSRHWWNFIPLLQKVVNKILFPHYKSL